MNIEPDTEICVCNSLSVADIAKLIKEKNLKTLEEILENDETPIGDKCEACHDEGYHNDGLNIPMVLSMVQSGRL
jgi:bacterioferritin-associated ferredoxin